MTAILHRRQATALVSLSTCGAMTGFTFAHGTVADMTSPTSVPVHLLAQDQPATPASPDSPGSQASPASPEDGALRSAIVSVAPPMMLLMARAATSRLSVGLNGS